MLMRQRREAGNFIDLGELPDSATSRPVAAGVELRLDLVGGVVLQIVRR